MTPVLSAAIVLGVALVLGILVPFIAMRLFVPTLQESDRAAAVNYRGARVFTGLGVVWLVWSACGLLGGGTIGSILLGRTSLVVLLVAGAMALAAFALGLVDDVFGSPETRGFKGHLRALRDRRVTTGLIKLAGISLASLGVARWGVAATGGAWTTTTVLFTVIAGAAIALTSNLVNLLDFRPGRALKGYLALGVVGTLSAVSLVGPIAGLPVPADVVVLDVITLIAFVAGPALAVWRYDLGEQGMLGDAGANAMGAVAGLLVVSGLSLPMLLIYAGAVLSLNLLSERVSFNAVIDRTPWLHRLDELGRPLGNSPEEVPAALGAARYDATDDHDSGEA